ncbi:hypothetical protein [Pseudomonas sp. PDM27]|uniref:hypothetical protein n=1 Tax=Pseudomonas sp. PDM27 TaxID=2854769 RepID=UPI001C46E858|nr:hypothetical protein [Pseudomonas sp. PDM27]MBV7566010.1 hypothetical protein [Pseudomonas sp. PDM27]
MVDFTKYSVPMLYSRNKNLEYKQHVIDASMALLGFLWREGLIANKPFDDAGGLKMDFIVKLSDLSPEGVELFKKAVPAWLQKVDRGGDRSDVVGLEKELKKIRSK